MYIDALTHKLRDIKKQNNLSFEKIAALLGFTKTYVSGMHGGRFKIHPRTIRLLELELAEQKRTRRRRA